MSDKSSFWKKIWEAILQFFASLSQNQSGTGKQPISSTEPLGERASEAFKDTAKELAADFLANKASGLISKYGNMLDSLDPKQKEYAIRMAYLKSVDPTQLSLEETIELGNAINEAARLRVEINEELNSFWSEVFDVVSEAAEKFAEVGVKVLSTTLIGLIL